jgi:4-hydroxy-tetrahydrodipicolinate reductase
VAIRVLVNGAGGKMGRQVCRAVLDDPELELAGGVDINPSYRGKDIGELLSMEPLSIYVEDSLESALAKKPDVMVDFTHPKSVMDNIRKAISAGINTVVGTTGIKTEDLVEIESLLRSSSSNVFIAPNFAIGAVLMIEFSKIAARHLKACEIVELHHDQKADSPSGTALKTAEGMHLPPRERLAKNETETLEGVRGGVTNGVHIHSVRLPGFVAHQEVIFGGVGQILTIRHDSISRQSFMPGVVMAIKAVSQRKDLTYGLEKILEI